MVILRAGSVHPGMSKEVLYIGSAVPLETSEGLEAIQQPLRSRYPVNDDDIQGIPAILTITSGGIQLKYLDDPAHVVFFPFSALNLCAAVRCITSVNSATNEVVNKFVSLTESPNSDRPAIFTTITRRTQGRHVLECSGFLTKNPQDALELVQWTSVADKRSKMEGGFLSMGGAASNQSHHNSRQDISFQTDSSSPETPVNIVPGLSVTQSVKPAVYNELPRDGYFYTTDRANVRKFSLHKFVRTPGPPPRPVPLVVPPPPPPPPVVLPPPEPEPQVVETPPAPVPVEVSQTVEESVNGDQSDKRSTYSMPVAVQPRLIPIRIQGPLIQPQPQIIRPQPQMVPVMMAPRPVMMAQPPPPHAVQPIMVRAAAPGVQPVLMRAAAPGVQPVMVRAAAPQMVMTRPGLVAGPPPGVAVRGIRPGVPMMMPVPMGFPPGAAIPVQHPKEKSPRRSSRSSSSSSSSSGSRSGRDRRLQVSRRDRSFDSNSRPRTPPRDYEPLHHVRSSRREEFQMRQVNGFTGGAATLLPARMRGLPPGYVMVPPFANGGAIYGAPTMMRSKSVPPEEDKKSKKEKKSKKKKKSKKVGKKEARNGHIHVSTDHESDNAAYSDLSPTGDIYARPHRPLDESYPSRSEAFGMSRMSKNLSSSQYQHQRSFSRNAAEKAFSNSLAKESRRSTRNNSQNAYTMNQNGGGDADFLLF